MAKFVENFKDCTDVGQTIRSLAQQYSGTTESRLVKLDNSYLDMNLGLNDEETDVQVMVASITGINNVENRLHYTVEMK